jgi:hypothetical protein
MQRCIFKVLSLLVHILALSDDNADHVELTVSAGLPDICKVRVNQYLRLKPSFVSGFLQM